MSWLPFIILLIVFEMIADILAKEWSLRGHTFLWIGSIAAYIIANVFWLSSLKNGAGLSRGAVIFSVASAILALFIGLVLYKETFSKLQITGMIFGVVSLVLIFSK